MPEVALIPPYTFTDDMQARSLQMLLPTCLRSHHRIGYEEVLRHRRRSHVILDNGIFEEDKPFETSELLSLAVEFGVDEVVMPDIPNNGHQTFEAVQTFLCDLATFTSEHPDALKSDLTLMAVVQGTTFNEITSTIDCLDTATPAGTVLGFPRRLTQGNIQLRIGAMEYVVAKYGKRFPLHMLGLSREWPGEFLRATRQFGSHLRGLDTDAPYVWAFNQGTLQNLWSADNERPRDYFMQIASRFNRHLVDYNIYVLTAWSMGLMPVPISAWKDPSDLQAM
jgi:hypothetical protein